MSDEPVDYKVLEDAYSQALTSAAEPSVIFHDGSLTGGECVGNAHVATGTGWCRCGGMREL